MNRKPDPERADSDNPEWTEKDVKEAVPLSGLPKSLQAKLRKRGRPVAAVTKESITIRLSPDVVARFRATGPGWQTRIDTALADWLKDHSPEKAST
jgi:uncharacterized protein (DUF4415 family)